MRCPERVRTTGGLSGPWGVCQSAAVGGVFMTTDRWANVPISSPYWVAVSHSHQRALG
jgi:hypothetical protein